MCDILVTHSQVCCCGVFFFFFLIRFLWFKNKTDSSLWVRTPSPCGRGIRFTEGSIFQKRDEIMSSPRFLFGCSLLIQPCASIPVCLQKELGNWKAWLLWFASSPWATLCFAVSRVTGSTHLVRSLAPTWIHPIQHLTHKLFAPTNKKPAGLTFIYLCSMYLTTKKAMSLAVWLTLAGSQDIAMLSMDHSATEAPLCCSKALQCTLTQVGKGLARPAVWQGKRRLCTYPVWPACSGKASSISLECVSVMFRNVYASRVEKIKIKHVAIGFALHSQ